MKEPSIEWHAAPSEEPKRESAAMKSPEAQRSDAEDVERFFDASLVELLEAHALRINEGTNGVIFKMNIEQIPGDLKWALKEAGIEWEGEQVMKALKIYQPGKGKMEFEMQKKAYDLVEQSEEEGLAKIPKPAAHRDLKLTSKTIEALKHTGLTDLRDHVEVIMMDYVPGKDLATLLYEEVVKRHPALKDTIKEPERMTFDELFGAVSNALGFARAGGKANDTGDRAFEKNVVFQNNAKKVYDFLDRSGFMLDGRILDQIERTMDELHKNGIVFRDGHHRNFMVTPGEKGEAPQAWVVDFGTATTFEGPYRNELYEEHEAGETKRYLDDSYVVNELRRFTKTPQERAADEEGVFYVRVAKLAERLRSNGPWRKYEDTVMKDVDGGTFDVIRSLARCPTSPDRLENFFVLLGDVVTKSPELRAEIVTQLNAYAQKAIPFDQQRIRLFLKRF